MSSRGEEIETEKAVKGAKAEQAKAANEAEKKAGHDPNAAGPELRPLQGDATGDATKPGAGPLSSKDRIPVSKKDAAQHPDREGADDGQTTRRDPTPAKPAADHGGHLPPGIGKITLADLEEALHDIYTAVRSGGGTLAVVRAVGRLFALVTTQTQQPDGEHGRDMVDGDFADRAVAALKDAKEQFGRKVQEANMQNALSPAALLRDRQAGIQPQTLAPAGVDPGTVLALIDAVVAFVTWLRNRRGR